MDHSHAVRHHFVEQYLLKELSAERRDEFEEHFFDCQECTADLRETSTFLQLAREELRKPRLSATSQRPAIVTPGPIQGDTWRRNLLSWRPALAWVALAACLVVVAYQNFVTFPHLHNEVASLKTAEVLPAVWLVGGNSRGGVVPSVTRSGTHSIVLQVDIPSEARFSSYSCSLHSPDDRVVWTVQVSDEEAKNMVFLRGPLPGDASGTYFLKISGNRARGGPKPVELATFPFTINAGGDGTGPQDKSKLE